VTTGRRFPARLAAAVLAVVALVALSACEVDVEVAVTARLDGSGTVEVAVGFDPDALARLGDPATALALGDLEGTAWTVEPPAVDDAGVTWVRARRDFADPAGLATALDEVAGPDGPLSGTTLVTDDGWFTSSAELRGVVDLSAGLAPYTDPDLDAATDGVPFGGLVAQVEADTGRPVSELLDVSVRFTLGSQSAEVTPTIGDPPVAVDLATSEARVAQRVGTAALAGVVLVGVVAGAVVFVRRRRVSERPTG